ncbi:MAG: UDP-N-acetylmuramoyl-tripeptide--D-alanyl-D-alanine ligase [Elusimicrobiota bacterium]
MEKIKITKITKIIKGHLSGNKKIVVSGVSIDSRTTNKGDIFFAIKGEKYDGHNFVKNAVKNGAVAVVVSQLSRLQVVGQATLNSPACKSSGRQLSTILVKDTIKTLQDFAKYYRTKFSVKVIGITGSNGKTTTKDMLASILSQRFSILATQGNLNNHIGLPLTLFNMTEQHKYCILEMGANHTGEIARLSEIAKPACGIITNISNAHIGEFGSLENIVKTKMELLHSLGDAGIAIINNDDKLISTASKKIKCMKKTFGLKNKADITASDIVLKPHKTSFILRYGNKKTHLELPVCGKFNIYNALAASTCATCFGIEIDEIADGIKNFKPSPKRMEVIKTSDGIIIVNDSYNANPTSMWQAIENFSEIFYNKRKILVLGDMLELGSYAVSEHKKLGEFIVNNKLADTVYTVGDLSRNISNSKWFKTKNQLFKYLKKNLERNDAVFFKASRKIGLDKVAESLIYATTDSAEV